MCVFAFLRAFNLLTILLFYIHTEICPALTDPSNGHVNYTSTTFTSLAYYTCNDRYQINGATVVKCIRGGLWNSTPPTCQGIQLHSTCMGFHIMH